MTTLFLPSWYPNKLFPQNGDFIQRHAVAVSGYCKVAVLYVLADPDAKEFNVEEVWHKGVFEVRVYYPKIAKWRAWAQFRRYMKAHRMGYQSVLKKMGKIDLVHLNVFYKAGLFALELKNKQQIPYIITEHWTAFLDISPIKFTPFQKHSILKIGNNASLLCPVSHDLKKALQQFGFKGPYEVVPNVVDTKLFRAQSLKSDPTKIKLLHVSTLYDPHKNVSGLLNVIKKLSDVRQDFSLSIIGNAHIEKHRQGIKALGIEHLVSIVGEVPHETIATAMQAHDLFVLFSNYENLPCVIIEAQASGLPVLTTDVGGISEMINEKSGQLVKAGDEAALLQKLHMMMDQLDQYNREEIRQQAVEQYSYESVGKQFFEIYKRVLNETA